MILSRRVWSRLAAALLAVALSAASARAQDTDVVVIDTATGEHSFTVELADTQVERARGLMFRQSLDPDRGMLFDFGRDDEVAMWMQNTYIPLDMIFIRADGTVHRIARDTEPFSTDAIPSHGPVRSVLEIVAGGADRIGLKPGDAVRHPIFSNTD